MTNHNTNETHARFWARMGELFGRKWFDEYGSEIPVSWREMLDKYTPKELKAALDALRNRKSEFLPAMPEVSQACDAARARLANNANDPNEIRRGYWRATIIAQVGDCLGYRQDPAAFEQLVIANKSSLGQSMAVLLDEVVDSEIRTGQRTRGHEDMVAQRVQRIGVAFNQLRAAR